MIKCVGCLIYDKHKDMFLLQQRGKKVSHALKWGFWGGKLERGESFHDGLERELTEELGTLPDIEKIIPLDCTVSTDGDFVYYSYIIVVDTFDNFKINHESNDYVWLPLKYVNRIDLHRGAAKTIRKNWKILSDCVASYNP